MATAAGPSSSPARGDMSSPGPGPSQPHSHQQQQNFYFGLSNRRNSDSPIINGAGGGSEDEDDEAGPSDGADATSAVKSGTLVTSARCGCSEFKTGPQ